MRFSSQCFFFILTILLFHVFIPIIADRHSLDAPYWGEDLQGNDDNYYGEYYDEYEPPTPIPLKKKPHAHIPLKKTVADVYKMLVRFKLARKLDKSAFSKLGDDLKELLIKKRSTNNQRITTVPNNLTLDEAVMKVKEVTIPSAHTRKASLRTNKPKSATRKAVTPVKITKKVPPKGTSRTKPAQNTKKTVSSKEIVPITRKTSSTKKNAFTKRGPTKNRRTINTRKIATTRKATISPTSNPNSNSTTVDKLVKATDKTAESSGSFPWLMVGVLVAVGLVMILIVTVFCLCSTKTKLRAADDSTRARQQNQTDAEAQVGNPNMPSILSNYDTSSGVVSYSDETTRGEPSTWSHKISFRALSGQEVTAPPKTVVPKSKISVRKSFVNLQKSSARQKLQIQSMNRMEKEKGKKLPMKTKSKSNQLPVKISQLPKEQKDEKSDRTQKSTVKTPTTAPRQ